METLKMYETFIHFLKGNEIIPLPSPDRYMEGACSLSFFHPDHPDIAHPDHWEIHAEGDELLLVTDGELEVEL